jgi:hypothetical protein
VAERPLIERMRAKALEGHPRAKELNGCADKLERTVAGGDARAIVGAWARAKRLWMECTGEPLVPQAVTDASVRLLQVLDALRSKS